MFGLLDRYETVYSDVNYERGANYGNRPGEPNDWLTCQTDKFYHLSPAYT